MSCSTIPPFNFNNLSSEELLKKTHSAIANERQLQAEVIRLLAEVDRRRLYASLGYRSLFDFCVKELRYSESAAWRRISAMRLLKEIPDVESKLISGEVSLKTLTTVQNFLHAEQRELKNTFTTDQKKKILESVQNKSARETESILASLSPAPRAPHERERPLSAADIEIRFVADVPLLGKFNRLKDLNSHRDPTRSYRGLFNWLSDMGLKSSDPLAKTVDTRRPSKEVERPSTTSFFSNQRYIPAELRRAVWRRDEGKCTFQDPRTGRRCAATSFIEIDHILPHGLGGETSLDNLRLYCRTHNLEAARKTYGAAKIDQHLSKEN